LFEQRWSRARFMAWLRAGIRIAARIAMIAMTISSSIRVKARAAAFRFM
jgi:hypothetical protein